MFLISRRWRREIEDLLFADRLVCADPAAFAAVHGKPQFMTMGKAVGTAAALTHSKGAAVQALDLVEIVAALVAQVVRGIGGEALLDHAPALQP